jgi:ribose/xylose/arabinose/galactoside ABC-type transport system permease subunit
MRWIRQVQWLAQTGPGRWLLGSRLLVVWLMAGYLAVLLPVRPEVASPTFLLNLLIGALPLLVVAVGQLFVLLVGGIDLSVAAVISLASVVGARVLVGDGAVLPAVAGMAAVGMAAGAFHGVAVAVCGLPAFLVTLSSMMFLDGLAKWITQARPITGLPAEFLNLSRGSWLGVPGAVWGTAVVVVVAHTLLRQTVAGRQLVAVGHNARAAVVSGVPVVRVVVLAYVVCGLFAAAATVLYMGRLGAGKADLLPPELLIDVVGALVLGGASLRGGRGSVPGTALGVLFIALVDKSLPLLDLGHGPVLIAKGGIILLAALADALRSRGAA